MAAKTINVGVVGYGMSAHVFHIPFIVSTPGLKLHAVVQRSPTAESDAAKDHEGIKSYRSIEELVQDPEVEAVVITTTPEVHYAHTKLALEAGKHVLLEKPATPTARELEALIAIAKKHNAKLCIYQNRRWDTDFLTVQKLLKESALGRIVEFESHFDRYVPAVPQTWKGKNIPGGGAIYDLGTHLLDQIVYLFDLPKSVTAFIGTQRTKENNPDSFPDFFTIILQYSNGLTAIARSTVISPEPAQFRYWVRGEKGSYKKFYEDVQEKQLRFQGKKPTDADYAQEPKENYGILSTVQEDKSFKTEVVPTVHEPNYRTLYEAWAKAIAGDGEVPVPPEGAAKVIRLIELAKESAASGKTVVL